MLLLRDSRPADSMSMSISFWPSTIATRSSSACVALNSIRFMQMTPLRAHGVAARVGQRADANGSGRNAAPSRALCAGGPPRRTHARRPRAGPGRTDDSVRRHGVQEPHWLCRPPGGPPARILSGKFRIGPRSLVPEDRGTAVEVFFLSCRRSVSIRFRRNRPGTIGSRDTGFRDSMRGTSGSTRFAGASVDASRSPRKAAVPVGPGSHTTARV